MLFKKWKFALYRRFKILQLKIQVYIKSLFLFQKNNDLWNIFRILIHYCKENNITMSLVRSHISPVNLCEWYFCNFLLQASEKITFYFVVLATTKTLLSSANSKLFLSVYNKHIKKIIIQSHLYGEHQDVYCYSMKWRE